MKFDSVEKLKKVDVSDNFMSTTAAKMSSNTYDLTNIDKIQDRIHKILAKKWVFIFLFFIQINN